MEMKEKCLSKQMIYDGKVVKLEISEVICPNGLKSKREIVRHNGGAAILCLIDGKVLLIRQYRYAYDDIIYEIPAGKIEFGEDAYNTAIRELKEETGYIAESLSFLGKMYPSCGFTNEILNLYLALDPKCGDVEFDQDEFIEHELIPLEVVLKMIDEDKICDAKTIVAINKYLYKKECGSLWNL